VKQQTRGDTMNVKETYLGCAVVRRYGFTVL